MDQFKDSPGDVFTYKIICHKDDEAEIRYWIRGSIKKVIKALIYLKHNSPVYANVDIEQMSKDVEKV